MTAPLAQPIPDPNVVPPDVPPHIVPDQDRGALGSMLKTPTALARRIREDRDLPMVALQLLLGGLLCHAAYGFAMALFDSAGTAAMTAWKAPVIAVGSALLCLPSLYVFSGVGGMPISLIQTVTLGCSALAMTGLLLLGMTPVSWLFSVSTNSLRFVVIMNVVAWAVSIGFVFRFFRNLQFAPDGKKTAGIKWWLCVYVVVSLQMATVMRPLLGRPPVDAPRPKTFFLAHFTHCMKEAPRDASRHP